MAEIRRLSVNEKCDEKPYDSAAAQLWKWGGIMGNDKTESCDHSGEKRIEVTKSGVYRVCADCGKRLKKIDSKLVIEKVIVPELLEKL